ncbi:hypothetical protein [Actinomycetospora soli]|uniref:hypothetical protein n=1 Tax=Actinomycetospora soli TaxID=2893887 RepID=UPI001E31EB7C|nr:hypothetical protein [Actinomycetospora soli]MCD2191379.1 hypothetical protein [Actinomycetospora soli]
MSNPRNPRRFIEWVVANGNDISAAKYVADEYDGGDANIPTDFRRFVIKLVADGLIRSTMTQTDWDGFPLRVAATAAGRSLAASR